MNSLNTWFFGVVIIPLGIKGYLEAKIEVNLTPVVSYRSFRPDERNDRTDGPT